MTQRSFSSTFKSAALAQRTGEYWLFLLKLSHTDITDIRIVNDRANVTSGGYVYTAYPFSIVMPDDIASSIPRVQVVIDNVAQEVIDEIRSVSSAITVTLSIILGNYPNVVEWGPYNFKLRNVRIDDYYVRGDLKIPYEIMQDAYPPRVMTPDISPGSV